MRFIFIAIFFIFSLVVRTKCNAQNNIVYGAGVSYTNGAPTFTPPAKSSRLSIDTVTGNWYEYATPGGWRMAGYRLQNISGCAAPAYTPSKSDSRLVVNGCSEPEVYYYTGAAWVQINSGGGGGGVYVGGEGIVVDSPFIRIDTLDRLTFNQSPTLPGGVATMRWNDTDGTAEIGLKGGNVTLQLGQEQCTLVKHADNTGLTDGYVVYIVGSDGTNKTVRYAQANTEAASANTFGVMTESATGGNKAFCTTFGLVRNINTASLTEGAVIWLSAATAGGMTTTRPTAPNHAVQVGFCIRSHATQGVIFVSVQNGYELNELHDVLITSPTNGQALTYNSAGQTWVNTTLAGITGSGAANRLAYWSGTSSLTSTAAITTDGTELSATKLRLGAPNAVNRKFTIQANSGGAGALRINTNIVWNTTTGAVGTMYIKLHYFRIGSNYYNTEAGIINISILTFSGTGAYLQCNVIGGWARGTSAYLYKDASDKIVVLVGSTTDDGSYTFYVDEVQYNLQSDVIQSLTAANSTTGLTLISECRNIVQTKSSPFVLNSPQSGNITNNVIRLSNNTGAADTEVAIGLFPSGVDNAELSTPVGETGYHWTIAARKVGFGQPNLLFRNQQTVKATLKPSGALTLGTTSTNDYSALEVTSTTGGVLFPRMTTTQRDAIVAPPDGLVIYNTTAAKLQVRAASAWADLH